MKVLVLGAGGMGAKAAEIAATFDAVTALIIADLDFDAAQRTALACGPNGQALQLDVTDHTALRAALNQADAVLNCVGPFFRFGVPILTAAIETGTTYFDICDDPEPTLEMLALDAQARANNVLAIVGMGASPGISNLLAAKTCRALDSIDHLITGWNLDDAADEEPEALGGDGGSAALVHWMEQCSGTVQSWEDGQLSTIKPLQPLKVTYPGIGKRTLWTVGHPEPVTLPRTFPNVRKASNAMVLNALDALALRDLGDRIDAGKITINEAATEMGRSISSSDTSLLQSAISWIVSKFSGPDFPSIFAIAEGTHAGQPSTATATITAMPKDGMAGSTGVPLAVALRLFTEGKITSKGVLTPEAALDPDQFFQAFLPYCTVPGVPATDQFIQFTVT